MLFEFIILCSLICVIYHFFGLIRLCITSSLKGEGSVMYHPYLIGFVHYYTILCNPLMYCTCVFFNDKFSLLERTSCCVHGGVSSVI